METSPVCNNGFMTAKRVLSKAEDLVFDAANLAVLALFLVTVGGTVIGAGYLAWYYLF